jgi:VWFA-related protein
MKTALLLMLTAALQQVPPAPRAQKLVVNVTDSGGRFIQGMQPQDFILEEDNAELKVTGVAESSSIPLSIGILVDKSTSMRLPLYVQGKAQVSAALLAAAGVGRAFVRLMQPQDEFILMTFDEKVQVRQNFTNDRKRIEDQLYRLNTVGGATHLYDAVIEALEKMDKAKYRRRALLVITDAYDTSGKELEELRDELAGQEIQVFSFGLRTVFEGLDPASEPLFQLVLQSLSRDTGGLSMVVDVPELQTTSSIEGLIIFTKIIELGLRGQYTVSYESAKTGPLSGRVIRARSRQPGLRVTIRRDAEDPLRPR